MRKKVISEIQKHTRIYLTAQEKKISKQKKKYIVNDPQHKWIKFIFIENKK